MMRGNLSTFLRTDMSNRRSNRYPNIPFSQKQFPHPCSQPAFTHPGGIPVYN